MTYMHKNVNLFLFLLIIIVVLSMVGGTVFYGSRFTNITSDYNDLIQQVESLNLELIKFKAEYNISQALLAKTETEQRNLKKVYTVQTGRLSSDVQMLNSTLASTKLTLDQREDQLEDTKDKLESAESKVASRGRKISCYKDILTVNTIEDTC